MNVLRWFALAVLPTCLLVSGCLLVQPLDEAKSDEDSGGSTSIHSGGSTHSGGASSKAGNGPTSNGGAPRGGAPAGGSGGDEPLPPNGGGSGVDFTLFTGTWTVTSWAKTGGCDSNYSMTTVPPGGTDSIGLGTTSDLIFDPTLTCPILLDVSDRIANDQPGQGCSFVDEQGFKEEVEFVSFKFEVGEDSVAKLDLSTYDTVTDGDGLDHICIFQNTVHYARALK